MIIWLNGSFGVGKSATAKILHEKIPHSHIYDPEQTGYFLWDNFPDEMKRKGDFQDMYLWRNINYEIIRYLAGVYSGDIIIPMTLVKKQYFAEIIGRLEQDGIEIKHFILCASKERIIARLLQRGEAKNSWAEQQIDQCLRAFANDIQGIPIDTNAQTALGAAASILEYLKSHQATPGKAF